jgi:photosystem II stability/assembly factor-like uncharacterized protein
VAASLPSTVYAVLIDDPGWLLGVYRSTDSGANWTRIDDASIANLVADFGWYFAQIRADPTDPDRAYVLGVTAHRTTNGGSSWSEIGSGMHVDHHALWIDANDPGHMYMGNDGGFYRTTNGGSGWAQSTNLPITQFYNVTVDFQLPSRIYGGSQDNSTPGTKTGIVDDWDTYHYGDGFYTLVDPTDSNVIYAEAQYGRLAKSTNGGKKFNSSRNGILTLDRRNWSTPVVMDPVDPNVLYYGTYRVYRTVNAAADWTPISGDLTDGEDPGALEFGTITTLGVTTADPQTVLAGTDDGHVWITFDGGAGWNDITAGLPDRWITRVAVDPADNQRLYVTLSGFHLDEPLPHVFTSGDGGGTWENIASDLPPVPLNDIVIDPESTNRLYVASDAGVFWSVNRGASWQPLGVGFPNAPVHSLHLHSPTRRLVAGTHGRSTYAYDLGTVTAAAERGAPPGPAVAARPNPTRGAATLSFDLTREGRVTAEIFDLRGALVSRLADERYPAGPVSLRWDASDRTGRPVAAGTYFYRVRTDAGVRVGKIVRTR